MRSAATLTEGIVDKEDARGYGQFCPVAKAAEVFAQRWTPLIARELCFGPKRFSEIQSALPLMSRSLLVRRLQELRTAGVLETVPAGTGHVYRFTPAGEGLRPIVEAMSVWGQRWGQGYIRPDDLDPGSLLWAMKRQIDPETVPESGLVVRFDFRGLPDGKPALRYWWLVLRSERIDVCQRDLGTAEDVVIAADLAALVSVWMGYEGLGAAVRKGVVSFAGAERAIADVRRILALPVDPGPKMFKFMAPTALSHAL
jgi:DNA-binding HxlR family transcriptional regulator